MGTTPESAAVEAAAWQLIGEDGEPAFVPYTRHEDALAMVAFYQDDKWLQPRDQEVFTIRELYPQSALDALRGEVERLRTELSAKGDYVNEALIARADAAERRVAELEDVATAFLDAADARDNEETATQYPEHERRLREYKAAREDLSNALTKESP